MWLLLAKYWVRLLSGICMYLDRYVVWEGRKNLSRSWRDLEKENRGRPRYRHKEKEDVRHAQGTGKCELDIFDPILIAWRQSTKEGKRKKGWEDSKDVIFTCFVINAISAREFNPIYRHLFPRTKSTTTKESKMKKHIKFRFNSWEFISLSNSSR